MRKNLVLLARSRLQALPFFIVILLLLVIVFRVEFHQQKQERWRVWLRLRLRSV